MSSAGVDNTAKVVVVPSNYTGPPKGKPARGGVPGRGPWDKLNADQKKAIKTAATVLLGAAVVVGGVTAYNRNKLTKEEEEVAGVVGTVKREAKKLKNKAEHALDKTESKGKRSWFFGRKKAESAKSKAASALDDGKSAAKSSWFGLKKEAEDVGDSAKAKAEHAKAKADKAADHAAEKAQEAHNAIAQKAHDAAEASKHAARNSAAAGGGVIEKVGHKVKDAGSNIEGKGASIKAHWDGEEAASKARGCSIM